jgi:tol-pal system protein YbgF
VQGYAVKSLFVVACVSTLIGCSSIGAQSHARSASDEATLDAELTALRLKVDEQEQELRTVRGQLALARAEVQELKSEDTFRSQSRRQGSDGEPLPWARNERGGPEMARVLELDGEVVEERLPTTSEVPDLPDLPPFVSATPGMTAAPEPRATVKAEEVSVEGYRRGLSLIREQKFSEALVELDAFSSEHPSHPYADNALYWCGEIYFLRHEYASALRYFERIEKLHPWANKTPDALYRMGQIYLRRGDTARAQAYFEKVREQFPDTAAARLALREDAS